MASQATQADGPDGGVSEVTEILDVINFVDLHYEKGASGNAFLPDLKASNNHESLERNYQVSRCL